MERGHHTLTVPYNMYHELISNLVRSVPSTILDMEIGRVRGRAPSQAFSEFLTNREQGDWAEKVIFEALNSLDEYVALKYGRSDDIVAGEAGFPDFYAAYQDELDAVGKRPDILLFRRNDWKPDWGTDISNRTRDELNGIVPHALAGLEIRSSSFLIGKYDLQLQKRQQALRRRAFEIRDEVLTNHKALLDSKNNLATILADLDESTIGDFGFRVPSWRSSQTLVTLSGLLRELKRCLSEYQKRDFLSLTPKVEDLKVVLKWIDTYGVPHYYFQVFFDRVYGISFEKILRIVSDSSLEDKDFFIDDGDAKNQNKATIKLNVKSGTEIAHRIEMPEHQSRMRELERGRLLFYVTFKGGVAHLNVDNLIDLVDPNHS